MEFSKDLKHIQRVNNDVDTLTEQHKENIQLLERKFNASIEELQNVDYYEKLSKLQNRLLSYTLVNAKILFRHQIFSNIDFEKDTVYLYSIYGTTVGEDEETRFSNGYNVSAYERTAIQSIKELQEKLPYKVHSNRINRIEKDYTIKEACFGTWTDTTAKKYMSTMSKEDLEKQLNSSFHIVRSGNIINIYDSKFLSIGDKMDKRQFTIIQQSNETVEFSLSLREISNITMKPFGGHTISFMLSIDELNSFDKEFDVNIPEAPKTAPLFM